MRRVLMAITLGAASMAAAGCDEPLSDLGGPTPGLQPTFSSIQREIFESGDSSGRVPCVQCHNPGGRQFAGGLDLTGAAAHPGLVNASSRLKPGAVLVVPGDPENSYLVHKLEGRADIAGLRMPRIGPPLTDGQIQIIEAWIAQGARND